MADKMKYPPDRDLIEQGKRYFDLMARVQALNPGTVEFRLEIGPALPEGGMGRPRVARTEIKALDLYSALSVRDDISGLIGR